MLNSGGVFSYAVYMHVCRYTMSDCVRFAEFITSLYYLQYSEASALYC